MTFHRIQASHPHVTATASFDGTPVHEQRHETAQPAQTRLGALGGLDSLPARSSRDILPPELWHEIARHLDPSSIERLSRVDHSAYAMLGQERTAVLRDSRAKVQAVRALTADLAANGSVAIAELAALTALVADPGLLPSHFEALWPELRKLPHLRPCNTSQDMHTLREFTLRLAERLAEGPAEETASDRVAVASLWGKRLGEQTAAHDNLLNIRLLSAEILGRHAEFKATLLQMNAAAATTFDAAPDGAAAGFQQAFAHAHQIQLASAIPTYDDF